MNHKNHTKKQLMMKNPENNILLVQEWDLLALAGYVLA